MLSFSTPRSTFRKHGKWANTQCLNLRIVTKILLVLKQFLELHPLFWPRPVVSFIYHRFIFSKNTNTCVDCVRYEFCFFGFFLSCVLWSLSGSHQFGIKEVIETNVTEQSIKVDFLVEIFYYWIFLWFWRRHICWILRWAKSLGIFWKGNWSWCGLDDVVSVTSLV